MSKFSTHLWKVPAALAALGLMAAAANAQTATTPKRGGTVVAAVGGEPTGLNPNITSSTAEVTVGCYIYEGLVIFNNQTEQFEPVLAESWTITPDGKTYTFKLRKAVWHDGQPVTSEDVRFSIVEVASKSGPAFAARAGKLIDAVETPDPQTVIIKLKEPYGPMLRALTCSSSAAIMPAHIYKGTDVSKNPANRAPVGTGAFKFSDWKSGSHLTLVKHDKYWDAGKPYLDSVIVRFMPNPASRTQALLAGEVDYIPFTFFPPSDLKTVDSNPNTKREFGGLPNMLYAFFNLKRKPFDDLRVRNALLTATDRNFIFNNAFFGLGRPGSAPWATQLAWAANPDVNYEKSHPFNPEKAAQMLEEAGYKADANGVRLKLTISYDPAASERGQTAMALQAMWKRAGVEVTLTPVELAVLLPRVHQEANFDVYLVSYTTYGDPGLGVMTAYTSSMVGVILGNASGYSNPEVDALFDKAAKLTTLEERGAIYKQLMTILMRDLPAMTLHENRGLDAGSKKLKGGWGWAGGFRFANAWLDQ